MHSLSMKKLLTLVLVFVIMFSACIGKEREPSPGATMSTVLQTEDPRFTEAREHMQTISQPYIVALMTQGLALEKKDRVLEIGTGSGYQAAVLAEMVDEVYTIEIVEELAERANKTLRDLGYENVEVKTGDGYFGWEERAPFDAIIVTCATNHIPPPLIEQLNDGGRLILPLGSTKYYQTLTLVEKRNGSLETRYITSVRFVPMTGEALKRG
ncbi:MAG: protein-L-isoaspartate O-methyltransferase [Candidatus Altiarchaeales archaeon ex4484_43]|nr:MAG: protein-L-isoaspartate O-methyltransferase [Candidatus Altiarchaeales archaeon ex4484_43]